MSVQKSITKHPMFHDPDYPRQEALTKEQLKLVAFHNDGTQNGKIALEEVPCLCGSEDFDLVATYDRYRVRNQVVLCRHCGLIQSHPRYTEESNFWFYNSGFHLDLYTNGGFEVPTPDEFVIAAKRHEARQERALHGLDKNKVRTVAEVGCQSGLNLYGFHEAGCEVFGCDFGEKMLALGRRMGMDLQLGSTELLAGRKFDLIILSHVLEHMRDPVGEVAKIVEHIEEGGGLYIEVPNADVFDVSDLQSAHLYYFSPITLMKYLAPLGLKSVSESIADEIHFGMVFKKTNEKIDVSISGEYQKRRKYIIKKDRRDRISSVLSTLRLLSFARFCRNLIRRIAAL